MNKSTRILIVEDDKNASQALASLILSELKSFEIIGIAESVAEGCERIEATNPDLVLLDINLPDGLGLEILQNAPNRNFEVIFTTSYEEHAVKAFEMAALHYLIKPITKANLVPALDRYKGNETFRDVSEKIQIVADVQSNKPKKILLQTNGGQTAYNISDIVRCEADGAYTEFFFNSGVRILDKVIVSKNLQNYESILGDDGFVRVHKSHLINISYIKKYYRGRGARLVMTDGVEIPISQTRHEEISRVIEKHFKF